MKTYIKAALFIGGLALTAITAEAGTPTQPMANPIVDTTPLSKEDETKVYAFFKFSCPVCRNYHMGLEYWGNSLPKNISFQFIPVLEGDGQHIVSNESARAALMFWTAERAGTKAQRASFADAAYALTQDAHEQNSMDAWAEAVKTAEIKPRYFADMFKIEEDLFRYRADLQAHYAPTKTPTLVICGKWMISPDSTNGNQELFFQLANGLVSKCSTGG